VKEDQQHKDVCTRPPRHAPACGAQLGLGTDLTPPRGCVTWERPPRPVPEHQALSTALGAPQALSSDLTGGD